jgi:PII-like signaling protein
MNEAVLMKRLMIFIDESDRWHGKSLSGALIDRLNKAGCSGATVVRGSSGFGFHHKVHTTSIMDLSTSLPEIIILIDTQEKIDEIMPILQEMVSTGLLVFDDVQVLKMSKA